MERILSILAEALANYTLCVSYAFMSEPMGVDKFRELENRLSEFQDRHPLLPFQIKIIDEKLYNSLNDIYMFHMKTSISKAGVEERKRIASELENKIQKCQQRIYEVWSE